MSHKYIWTSEPFLNRFQFRSTSLSLCTRLRGLTLQRRSRRRRGRSGCSVFPWVCGTNHILRRITFHRTVFTHSFHLHTISFIRDSVKICLDVSQKIYQNMHRLSLNFSLISTWANKSLYVSQKNSLYLSRLSQIFSWNSSRAKKCPL